MIVLPITITIAAAAALLNIWIASRIGRLRVQHKILIGDAGNEAVIARMRAHANFVEYTAFVLILIGLIELAVGSMLWLWAVGILYVLARILHVFGMDRRDMNGFRIAGAVVSMLVTLGLALYALSIPYRHRPVATAVNYVEANQRPESTASATNGLLRRS
jgi:uncharacterized protein